jgi:ABC-type taurine transport system ATPase subunit
MNDFVAACRRYRERQTGMLIIVIKHKINSLVLLVTNTCNIEHVPTTIVAQHHPTTPNIIRENESIKQKLFSTKKKIT